MITPFPPSGYSAIRPRQPLAVRFSAQEEPKKPAVETPLQEETQKPPTEKSSQATSQKPASRLSKLSGMNPFARLKQGAVNTINLFSRNQIGQTAKRITTFVILMTMISAVPTLLTGGLLLPAMVAAIPFQAAWGLGWEVVAAFLRGILTDPNKTQGRPAIKSSSMQTQA